MGAVWAFRVHKDRMHRDRVHGVGMYGVRGVWRQAALGPGVWEKHRDANGTKAPQDRQACHSNSEIYYTRIIPEKAR